MPPAEGHATIKTYCECVCVFWCEMQWKPASSRRTRQKDQPSLWSQQSSWSAVGVAQLGEIYSSFGFWDFSALERSTSHSMVQYFCCKSAHPLAVNFPRLNPYRFQVCAYSLCGRGNDMYLVNIKKKKKWASVHLFKNAFYKQHDLEVAGKIVLNLVDLAHTSVWEYPPGP